MLERDHLERIDGLLAELSREQKIWLSGYVGGAARGDTPAAKAVAPANAGALAIFYATESGNSKTLAQRLDGIAKQRGIKTRIASLARVKPEDIAKLDMPAVFLISTQGEGDPPDQAKKFFAACRNAPPAWDTLDFAVLGLGDSSYAHYCRAADDLNGFLTNGGARAFLALRKLDVDFDAHAEAWMGELLDALPGGAVAAPTIPTVQVKTDGVGFSRLSPVAGEVREIVNLNDAASDKQTYHIAIGFEGELPYEPGDAAGILVPGTDMTPRLYSIASSRLAHANELHLTVALATHVNADGSIGYGVTSHYLAQRRLGDEIRFFIQRNRRFALPDDDRDIVMIGPGTGIAPFRAFIEERRERGATGRNWLFFGDRHQHLDFLYQTEWQDAVAGGDLTRISLAFSRDQQDKIYVQHRMREAADDLLDWLDGGASLYVCGAKSPMSEDVERTLLDIAATRHADAEGWLDKLAETDRYLKDVY